MINAIAIALLLSSLAAAGVFSPAPEQKPNHHTDEHLLREGHRLIVVEYERGGDPHEHSPSKTQHLVDEVKQKYHDAASHLPNLGQGVSTPSTDGEIAPATATDESQHHRSPKDVICDAYGRCKQRISGLVGKGADKAEEKTKQAEESVDGGDGVVKDVSSNISSAGKKAADKVEETGEAAEEKAKSARERVTEKARNMVNRARHARDKAAETGESAADKVREKVETAEEKVKEEAESAEEKVEAAGEAVRRNLSDISRRAKEVAWDLAMYIGAPETARAAAAVAHLVGVGVAYGTAVWVTFVSSHVMAQALPRQQFGLVQSRLYPVYFRVMAYGILTALLGHYWAENRGPKAERIQGYNLLASLALVIANMVFLEPAATKVMFERIKMEKEEGRGRDISDVAAEPVGPTSRDASPTLAEAYATAKSTPAAAGDLDSTKSKVVQLNKQLKALNSYSSFLNVLTLMGLTWHLVHLSRSLTVNA